MHALYTKSITQAVRKKDIDFVFRNFKFQTLTMMHISISQFKITKMKYITKAKNDFHFYYNFLVKVCVIS